MFPIHISFPQTFHPSVSFLANSSILGRSPTSCTILSRTTSGFLLCSSTGEYIICETPASCLSNVPRLPITHISALLRVQLPSPVKNPSPFLFALIHTKPTVEYSNPQHRNTSRKLSNIGNVTHINKIQSSAANSPTGSWQISSSSIGL